MRLLPKKLFVTFVFLCFVNLSFANTNCDSINNEYDDQKSELVSQLYWNWVELYSLERLCMLVESRIASHQKLKEDFYQKYEEIYQAVVSAKAKVNGGDLNLTNKYIKLIQKVKGDQELTEFLIEHFMNDPGSVFAWNKE